MFSFFNSNKITIGSSTHLELNRLIPIFGSKDLFRQPNNKTQIEAIIIAPTKFNKSPSLAISARENLLVENTMVFGAVATGSIKAQLALIAAGTIRASGLILEDKLMAARIGKISVVVAKLLVISVRKVINRQTPKISKNRCQLEI